MIHEQHLHAVDYIIMHAQRNARAAPRPRSPPRRPYEALTALCIPPTTEFQRSMMLSTRSEECSPHALALSVSISRMSISACQVHVCGCAHTRTRAMAMRLEPCCCCRTRDRAGVNKWDSLAATDGATPPAPRHQRHAPPRSSHVEPIILIIGRVAEEG